MVQELILVQRLELLALETVPPRKAEPTLPIIFWGPCMSMQERPAASPAWSRA